MSSSRASTSRRHVSAACAKCRQRKVRCDGKQPVCSFCSSRGYDCDYSQSQDGRRANRPHRKVAQLESEVEQLRQLLAEHNITAPSRDSFTAVVSSSSAIADEESPAVATTSTYEASDSLHFDPASGNLVFQGPTSIPTRFAVRDTTVESQPWLPGPPLDPYLHLTVSRDVSSQLVDLFFRHFNGFLAWIDEPAFRAGLAAAESAGIPAPSSYYSPFLHLAILSQAAHLVTDPSVHLSPDNTPSKRGWPYLQRAFGFLNAELERPRPSTVVALTLIMAGLSDSGKVSLSWLYSGITIRLSQDIGLHVNARSLVTRGILTEEELRQREDSFWTVYFQDKKGRFPFSLLNRLVGLYVGRSPAVTLTDFDLSLPDPSIDPLKAAFISLSNLISRLVTSLYSIRREGISVSTMVAALGKEIQEWYNRLPPSIQLSDPPDVPSQNVFMLHLLYNALVILYNRPFLRRHCLNTPEGQRCLTAALASLDLARRFDSTIGIRLAFITMTQCLYVPCSVLVLFLADLYGDITRQNEIDQIKTALQELTSLLTILSETWGTAQQAVAALAAMQNDYAVSEPAPAEEAETSAIPTTLDEQLALWSTEWPSLDLSFSNWGGVEDPLGLQQMGIW